MDWIIAHWKILVLVGLAFCTAILNFIMYFLSRKSNRFINNSIEAMKAEVCDFNFTEMLKNLYAFVPSCICLAEESGLTGENKLKQVVLYVLETASSLLGRELTTEEETLLNAVISNFVELVLSTPQKKCARKENKNA